MLLYRFRFTLYLRAISDYKAQGAYNRRDDLMEGFWVTSLGGGDIFGGAYFRNFTVAIIFLKIKGLFHTRRRLRLNKKPHSS